MPTRSGVGPTPVEQSGYTRQVEPVAIVVWVLIAVVAVALFVWWWLGVHRKSRTQQAAEALNARSARAARRAEKLVQGGVHSEDGIERYVAQIEPARLGSSADEIPAEAEVPLKRPGEHEPLLAEDFDAIRRARH